MQLCVVTCCQDPVCASFQQPCERFDDGPHLQLRNANVWWKGKESHASDLTPSVTMNLRASLDDAKTASALPLGRPFLTATKSVGPYSSHSQPVHLDDDLHRVSGLGEPVFHLTLAGTERQPIEFHNIAPRPESHVQSPEWPQFRRTCHPGGPCRGPCHLLLSLQNHLLRTGAEHAPCRWNWSQTPQCT